MTVARREDTDASITYSSAPAWLASLTDGYASGGAYRGTSNGGATATITIAAASGVTGFLLLCTSRADSARAVGVTVDGVAQTEWDQNPSGAGNNAGDGHYTQYRTCSRPYSFVGNGAHTIVITAPASGFTTFDGIDLFTAITPNAAKRYHGFGHSWLYAVTSGSNATRVPGRFLAQIATHLGLAEDNYGAPSEDLTNGARQSPNTGMATARYYNQQAVWTPGWMRAEAGSAWATPGTRGALWLADPPTGATWGARAPQRAAIMHGINDIAYEVLYEGTAAQRAIPTANQNASGTTPAPLLQPAGTVRGFFVQRMRELIARMLLEVPTIDAIDVFDIGNGGYGLQTWAYYTLAQQWNAALLAMTQESWIPAGKVLFVPTLDDLTGRGGFTASASDSHPNDYGHSLIFEAWRRAYEQSRAVVSGGIHR